MLDFNYTYFSDAATDFYDNYHDVTTDPWIFINAYFTPDEQVAYVADAPDLVSGNTMPFEVNYAATH